MRISSHQGGGLQGNRERPIEQDMLTDASRCGKRRKYTLKDINVEQETAEVTNPHEKKTGIVGNCNH